MNGAERESAFCHHIACNGAVYAAGDEQRCFACRTDRHTVGTGNLGTVDVCGISDLYAKRNFGLADINMQLREPYQHLIAHFVVYRIGIHEIVLV